MAWERPGWHVVEVNNESGLTFEVPVQRGAEHQTILLSADERIVGERRSPVRASVRIVLPEPPPTPLPVSALHPRSKHLSPRLRVLIGWLVEVLKDAR